jgi:hypothetical protein
LKKSATTSRKTTRSGPFTFIEEIRERFGEISGTGSGVSAERDTDASALLTSTS